MKIWSYRGGVLYERSSFLEAMGFQDSCPKVAALVGAGGKTSAMYAMADELAACGKRVIVTTSTHILIPEDRHVLFADRALQAGEWFDLRGEAVLVTGRKAARGKLAGLPEGEGQKLSGYGDVVLVEADGAKRLPLKVPAAGEPVIWPEAGAVVGCAGLDCIGMPLWEVCFRREEAASLLGKEASERLTAADVAAVLTSVAGTRKGVGGRIYRIVLNKADTAERLELAGQVIAAALRTGTVSEEQFVVTAHKPRGQTKGELV